MNPVDVPFDRSEEFDLVIATCGYEHRSSYLCRLGIEARQKFAIIYSGTDGGSFDSNRRVYGTAQWTLAKLDDVLSSADMAWADGLAKKIAVDISSMPRRTIGRIIQWLWEARGRPGLEVHFLYCPGEFSASALAATVQAPMSAGPISSFYSGLLRAPSIPIGLVVGLGLEPYRAAGIIELLEPARTWLFSAAMGDVRFTKAAEELHSSILGSVSPDYVFSYDVRSLSETYSILESLSFGVGLDYRLILAPSGPKLFSLACLLLGADRQPERPAVWRVGSARTPVAMDVQEAGDVCASVVQVVPPTCNGRPVSDANHTV